MCIDIHLHLRQLIQIQIHLDIQQKVGMSQVEELYPIALLMDELRHDDVASRVEAMKRLDTIAIALGPQRTREELIPFLEDIIPEDEDEVIAIAAEELGKFVSLVGGQMYAPLLIPVLEKISACEEPIVREKAIASLNSIAAVLSSDQITQYFIPLINRLAKERWFSLHIAATGLFKSIIARVSPQERLVLLKLYNDLIHDDSPMVRKASAKELPQLIDILNEMVINDGNGNGSEDSSIWPTVLEMYQTIVNDNQDSVKFLSVDILISILKVINSHKTQNDGDNKNINTDTDTDNGTDKDIELLFQSLISLIDDPSWRVRYMVADRIVSLIENFNDEKLTLKLVPYILSLMKDNEAEVRKAISSNIPGFSKLIDSADGQHTIVLNDVIPLVSQLTLDESENVRSALANQITGLAPILGKEMTTEKLLPLLVEMLKDEYSDVRLNIISNLEIVNEVIGIELLSDSLMPAITALANDKLWRVRLAIIEQIPLLAEQLGLSFFDESLGQLCMEWLWDPVYTIRNAAVKNLSKLTKLFGEDWCRDEIINKLIEKSQTKEFHNFICRLTCLQTFDELIHVVSPDIIRDYIYKFIVDLADDKVPNIRFNVAKSLLDISKALPESKEDIRHILERMTEDDDPDVRYFANQSLQEL